MEGNAVKEIERLVHDGFTVDVNGKTYSAHDMKPVCDRAAMSPIQLNTLTGVKDYIEGNLDELDREKMFIVVGGHNAVHLCMSIDKETKVRQRPVTVTLDKSGKEFPFGHFMAVEDFIIRLSSMFIETDDLRNVLGYVSRLTVNNSLQTEDDGVTQTATVRRGVSTALKDALPAPSRIVLKPMRTFVEVNQPESSFVFRMKANGDGQPLCAFFEADGGAWMAAAAQNIKSWLSENIEGVKVIA